jgi:hypothetical protein
MILWLKIFSTTNNCTNTLLNHQNKLFIITGNEQIMLATIYDFSLNELTQLLIIVLDIWKVQIIVSSAIKHYSQWDDWLKLANENIIAKWIDK